MSEFGSKKIETNRLILRKITIEDSKAIYEGFVNQKEFLYYSNKKERTLKEQIDSLKEIDKKYENPDYYNWLITLKSNEVIGQIVANKYNIENSVIINYAIDNRYTCQGYMKEALKAVLDYLINQPNITSVYCGCCIENIASKKVMEKYMKFVKTIKNHVTLSDGLHDMHLYVVKK